MLAAVYLLAALLPAGVNAVEPSARTIAKAYKQVISAASFSPYTSTCLSFCDLNANGNSAAFKSGFYYEEGEMWGGFTANTFFKFDGVNLYSAESMQGERISEDPDPTYEYDTPTRGSISETGSAAICGEFASGLQPTRYSLMDFSF